MDYALEDRSAEDLHYFIFFCVSSGYRFLLFFLIYSLLWRCCCLTFESGRNGKRRIRLIVVGFTIAVVPTLLFITVMIPIDLLFNVDLASFLGFGLVIVMTSSLAQMPLIFAYAIVRHKVIPVSFSCGAVCNMYLPKTHSGCYSSYRFWESFGTSLLILIAH